MPKISILVPIYKVEQYLRRCLDSVLAQDFEDWEMVLVDDGSPDACPQICEDYAARDTRIKVVHKQNGGLVSARLAGFREARAEYIMFLDSDDWLFPGALTCLYTKITEGYDVVKGRHQIVTDRESLDVRGCKITGTVRQPLQYAKALVSNQLIPYLWGGLYRKSLFTESTFENILSFSIYEDMLTNVAIWEGVNSYCAIDNVVCAYYINLKSMMQQKVVSREYARKTYQKLYEFTERNGDEELRHLLELSECHSLLRPFFFPEIGWDEEAYSRAMAFIRKGDNLSEVRASSDPKFTWFVRCKIVYRAYTWLYRLLFLWIKQKGVKRQLV